MKYQVYGGLSLVAILALTAIGQAPVVEEKPAPVVTNEQPMSFWMEKKLE